NAVAFHPYRPMSSSTLRRSSSPGTARCTTIRPSSWLAVVEECLQVAERRSAESRSGSQRAAEALRRALELDGAPAADEDLLAAVVGDVAHEPIGGVAVGGLDLRGRDQELKIEVLAELEEDGEVVLREAVRFVEEQEAQRAPGALAAEERGVALPLGEDDHHQRRADADGLARREPRRRSGLPGGAALALDLDGELDVFAVVEQALSAAPPARIATEHLVERFFDGQRRLKEQRLRRAVAQGREHLIHALDALHGDADPGDAAEAHAVEVLIESTHLAFRAAQLDVDAARDVLGGAAQV